MKKIYNLVLLKIENLSNHFEKSEKIPATKIAIFSILFVVILWSLTWLFSFLETETRGTLGDMFGTLNALFSGLAFVGVVYAILLQREQLRLQRDDNELTRKELLGQKEELGASNKLREHQNFENTFFQMLDVQQSIINSMDIKEGATKTMHSGRDCFRFFARRFNGRLNAKINAKEDVKLAHLYEELYTEWRSDLGHYFRVLYNLVKLVDNSDVQDKKFYTNIIRAQMSDYEVAILFLNCLSAHGSIKFKPLAEKYSLLKMMDTKLIRNSKELKSKYTQTAFS